MIDTDKYEELTMNDMEHLEFWELSRKLLAEVKRLRDGIQFWFDTFSHDEDDIMVRYFKRLIE